MRHDSFVHEATLNSRVCRQAVRRLSEFVRASARVFLICERVKKDVLYVKRDVLHVERDSVSWCVHYQMRHVAFMDVSGLYITGGNNVE